MSDRPDNWDGKVFTEWVNERLSAVWQNIGEFLYSSRDWYYSDERLTSGSPLDGIYHQAFYWLAKLYDNPEWGVVILGLVFIWTFSSIFELKRSGSPEEDADGAA